MIGGCSYRYRVLIEFMRDWAVFQTMSGELGSLGPLKNYRIIAFLIDRFQNNFGNGGRSIIV